MATTERQTFTGRVIKANDTGVILDTMPDVWLNRSTKGNAAALELPSVGESVTVTCTPWKDRWYIASVIVHHRENGRSGNAPESHQDAQGTAQGHQDGP